MKQRPFALLPLLGILAAPLPAQVVRGKVLDAASGEPVPQAEVTAASLEGRGAGRTRSAADGTFTLELRAAGTFRLRAERAGYRPTVTDSVAVDPRETVEVELRVSATAVAIEPLRVTARVAPPRRQSLQLAGFYDRERWGMGKYLRREDFERMSNMNLVQVINRLPGTYVIGTGPMQAIVFERATITGTLSRMQQGRRMDECVPKLYLDGVHMNYVSGLNGVATPQQLEAVEIYRSAAELPPQYGGPDAACGVILLWTRAEP
jgi:Carboxypeptidase regulatory-like domain